MRAAIAPMLEHGGGAIVNVASIYGIVGSAANAAYTASKHGVVGLTRSAALQYAPHSIRINAVCPGHSHTPMTAPLLRDPDWLPQRLARYPMRRLAQPEGDRRAGALAVLGRRLVRYRAGAAGGRRLYGAMTIR